MKNTIGQPKPRAFPSLAQSSCSRRYTPLYSPTRPKNRIPPCACAFMLSNHFAPRTLSIRPFCPPSGRLFALTSAISAFSCPTPTHVHGISQPRARSPTPSDQFFKKLAAFASIRRSKSMSKSVKSGPTCGQPSSISSSATTAFSTLSRFHACSRHFTGNPTAILELKPSLRYLHLFRLDGPILITRATRHGALPAVYCAQLDILGREKNPPSRASH
jgi:hypothetical protein